MILVDSNVIIDVLTEDAIWRNWSETALSEAADRDEVAINPIIYAEIASGFATIAELDHHPDFYIGAHAAVEGVALMTRDARRYRGYFPKLRLITPD